MTWSAIFSVPGMKAPSAPQPTPRSLTTMTIKNLIAFLALATLAGLQGSVFVHGQNDKTNPALEALTPGFWKLFDHKAQLTKVASGFGFTEGPVWDPAGYLWVSDETLNKIFKVDTSTGRKTRDHLSRRSGRQYVRSPAPASGLRQCSASDHPPLPRRYPIRNSRRPVPGETFKQPQRCGARPGWSDLLYRSNL